MHHFSEIASWCLAYNLKTLNELEEQTIEALQESGATNLVRTLQMIDMQKSIIAVGLFSIFEARLQSDLACSHGFSTAKEMIKNANEIELLESFTTLELAINALKHGRGRSYNTLIQGVKTEKVIKVKVESQEYFHEGDVAETNTLVKVDNAFLNHLIDVIQKVNEVVLRVNPQIVI